MPKIETLIKELFTILDHVEMSREGREFHPTTITSCHIMDTRRIETILNELRLGLGIDPKPTLRTRSEIEKGVCPNCNGTGDPNNHEQEWLVCETCVGTGRIDDK